MGIVGAMEIENDAFKLFNLSFRALGGKVVNEMSNYISDRYSLRNIRFQLTVKNESLRSFLQKTFSNVCFISS